MKSDKLQLTDESIYPDENVLKDAVGSSYQAYSALLEIFAQNDMQYEWRYYNDGKAWLCKTQKKKKTIVWMSAWEGFMKAAVYIPEKLMDQVYSLPINDMTKERIQGAKVIGKSKECMFEIRNQKDLEDLTTIMLFKIKAK
jgi:hypothetical protein